MANGPSKTVPAPAPAGPKPPSPPAPGPAPGPAPPPAAAGPATGPPASSAKESPTGAGPVTGMFEPPPAHAPKEVTQPLTEQAKEAMQAKANQNERELAPLKEVLAKAVATGAAMQAAGIPPPGVELPKGVQTARPSAAPNAPAGSQGMHGAPAVPEIPRHNPMPAASNTDSPSRGQPREILDPGKRITGGWGDAASAELQYYALDGTEVRAIAMNLFRELAKSMETDLRFGIACCYPQVAIRVQVEIAGAVASASINDVAFTADSRVLLLQLSRVDDQTTPADQLREETGIPRPYKHTVKTGSGSHIVDRDAVEAATGPSLEGEEGEPDAALQSSQVEGAV